MGKIGRGWKLIKTSLKILSMDKEILLFPLISIIISGFIVASFVAPVFLFNNFNIASDPFSGYRFWIYLFFLYLPLYFVGTFFNTAVVGCADKRMKGEDPTFRDGLKIASDRWSKLLAWSILASTVGIILQVIRNRVGFIGKLITSFIGIAWTYGTFFIIPVLIYQDRGVFSSIKESASLFKDTWGETLTGSLGFGLIFFLLGILGALPILYLTLSGMIGWIVALTIGGLYFITLFALYSALHGIFVTALYHYAKDGNLPDPYDKELIPSGSGQTSGFGNSDGPGDIGGAYDNLTGPGKI